MKWISVDFGTSSSAVAVINNNIPELVTPLEADAVGSKISPTVVWVNNDGTKIYPCRQAELCKAHDYSRFVQEFKLDMTLENHPFLPVNYVDITSSILNYLKKSAEYLLRGTVENVVITIPAIYDNTDVRQQVMIKAAEQAGFGRIELLNEAQAAAIYYDHIRGGGKEEITLVYDLGGGTFDPSLVKHTENGCQLLGNGQGIQVGGKFFTEKITKKYIRDKGLRINENPIERVEQINRLVESCESIKRHLTFNTEVSINDFRMTREEFENDIKSDIDSTLQSCSQLINDCEISWADINNVLLIGGSCAIPFVQRKIIEYCQTNGSQAKIVWNDNFEGAGKFDAQFAVAFGGAVYAKNKFSSPRTIGFLNYCECGVHKVCNLKEGLNSIGRYTKDNDLSLAIMPATEKEKKMSRRHCSVNVEYIRNTSTYKYSVKDDGSANGTYVNNEPINGIKFLSSGDRIKIGEHIIEITFL